MKQAIYISIDSIGKIILSFLSALVIALKPDNYVLFLFSIFMLSMTAAYIFFKINDIFKLLKESVRGLYFIVCLLLILTFQIGILASAAVITVNQFKPIVETFYQSNPTIKNDE